MSRARTAHDAIEALFSGTSQARATEYCVEVLRSYTPGVAPTGFFGGAVGQRVVEALVSYSLARVCHDVIEVLYTEQANASSSGGGTVGFGFAV